MSFKKKVKYWVSELAVPLVILAGAALAVWYAYASYEQCRADGYNPTVCRMMMIGRPTVIVPER
jgi:hypothetical protein